MTTPDLRTQVEGFRARAAAAQAMQAVPERQSLLPALWMVPEQLHRSIQRRQVERWLTANVVVDPREGTIVQLVTA